MEFISPFMIASTLVFVFLLGLLIFAGRQELAKKRERAVKKKQDEERRNMMIDGML